MRVLFIAQQWEPEFGVPQRRGRWMADQLMAHGHEVTVVAPPPHYPAGKLLSKKAEDQAGAISYSHSGEKIYRSRFCTHDSRISTRVLDQAVVCISSIPVALRAVEETNPDVIVTPAPPLPAVFTAFIVSKLKSVPFVVDLRDAWPEMVRYVISADPSKSQIRSVMKKAAHPAFIFAGKMFGGVLSQAGGIITTSKFHEKALNAMCKPITNTIFNDVLVDLSELPQYSSERESDELHILYTGNVGRAQGLENAVIAAQMARDRGVNVVLRFIGHGAHLPRIKEFTKDLNYIEFFDPSDSGGLKAHYKWADSVLVHLKDWAPLNQTVPSKLFSAIGSGKHVSLAANGEAEAILRMANVGDCVPAMDPEALANLWVSLSLNRERLQVGTRGIEWLRKTRSDARPGESLINFLEKAKRKP